MAASTVAAIAAVTSAVVSTAGAVVQGVSNYQQGKAVEAQSKINAAQEFEAEKQAHQEEALNATQRYRAARHEMAAGENLMSGGGNIGSSAEAALRGGYFNLSEDLSALRYRYDAEAAGHRTAGLNNQWNARVAKRSRKAGVLASGLNTTAAAASGVTNTYKAGVDANWWK